ncbi:hypothetical protein F4604DRAFT_1683995 [Suillus subluteus]|nr:hypothetical protein F4604DRAFT_1683995 [Suillus subluteus]
MSPYLQGRRYSHDSHTSSRNDGAEAILLGGVSASLNNSESATDNVSEDLFAGVALNVDRAMKLAEQLKEEYHQLKRDVEGWNARVEDTDKIILPLLKRRQMFSDALDVTPCKFGHASKTKYSPGCTESTPARGSIASKKCRRLQAPFEFSSRPTRTKTVAEAMSSIEDAIERQTLVLTRICEALGSH